MIRGTKIFFTPADEYYTLQFISQFKFKMTLLLQDKCMSTFSCLIIFFSSGEGIAEANEIRYS